MRGSGNLTSSPRIDFAKLRDQTVDNADYVVGLDEGHFQVELGEFRLTVGTQIFVAEATGHLHVAVVAGDHQNLFIELRRLRERIKRAVLDAAGNEIVAGAFGGAAAKHGSFDIEKTVLVEVVAHFLDDAVAELQNALRFGAAQIEKAIFQSQVFAGQIGSGGQKRRRGRAVENGQLFHAQFNFARDEFWIGGAFGTTRHAAGDHEHPFATNGFGQFQIFGCRFPARRRLGFSRSGRGDR